MSHIAKWNKGGSSVIFWGVKFFKFMIPVLEMSNCYQYFCQMPDFNSVKMTEKNFVLTSTQVAHRVLQIQSLEHIFGKHHLPVNCLQIR